MTTKVVNVKVKYIRPKYKNLKDWCEDKNNVYIARGGIVFVDGKRYPEKSSIFANPFKIGTGECTRENCIYLYRKHLKKKIESNEITQQDLDFLRGKNLGCWCKTGIEPDNKCHGDVILEILKEKETKKVNVTSKGYILGEDGYVVVKFIS